MRSLLLSRILRFALAISVSLWMAGAGCLLGCSNSVNASNTTAKSNAETVVAGDSCAAKHSHDCCAKKSHKQVKSNSTQFETDLPQLAPRPFGMMQHCPLAASASAVVSKARTDGSEQAPAATIATVFSEETIGLETRTRKPLLLNRGPTYLRCCVFLI